MINILLVDDEPLIREALLTLLDWEGHGFRIVGEAYNGMEALKIMAEKQVDIVLTDIKMPVMDGLELIQTARLNNTAVFVVLSAYDEFHLVSNAYKMGAKDYILKSEITVEGVIEVLYKAYQELINIRQQQKYVEEQEQTRQLFEKHYQAIRYKLLKEMIEGRFNMKQQQDLIKLGFRYAGDQVAVMVINVGNSIKIDDFKGDSSILSLAQNLQDYLENILNTHQIGNLLPYFPGEYVFLFCFGSKYSEQDIFEKISLLYNNIRRNLKEQFNVIASAGLSDIGKGLCAASELYKQAVFAYYNFFVQGKGKLIYYSHLPLQVDKVILDADRKIVVLKELLKSMEAEKIRDNLDFITIQIEVVSEKMVCDIQALFERYYVCIYEFAMDYFLQQELAPVLEEYNKNLRDKGDLKQLNDWIKRALLTITTAIEDGSYLINKARYYIHKNYHDNNISLTTVAREVGVNSSYLSRVFAKEVGCSFMDYLTKVRLGAALEYMKNSNLKIYEIAEKVGYSNAEHFSRIFKKMFGKSPKEYLR